MKRKIPRLLTLALPLLVVCGCTSGELRTAELTVFAAASMTETLEELKPVFEKSHPGVTVVYNFDSSGTLKTQIEEGAVCDAFISAGQKQMDELDAGAGPEANPDGLDFILKDSRINLLENRVVLCVPDPTSGAGVESFPQLAERLAAGDVLLCMGNSDVPVGQYTRKILDYFGLDETALANAGNITYGSNVKEVTTQISEASVDAGVIYCTDAFSAGLAPVDFAALEMCGRIIYPAAVMKDSAQPELAREYLNFLTSSESMEVFKAVGFSPAA